MHEANTQFFQKLPTDVTNIVESLKEIPYVEAIVLFNHQEHDDRELMNATPSPQIWDLCILMEDAADAGIRTQIDNVIDHARSNVQISSLRQSFFLARRHEEDSLSYMVNNSGILLWKDPNIAYSA